MEDESDLASLIRRIVQEDDDQLVSRTKELCRKYSQSLEEIMQEET